MKHYIFTTEKAALDYDKAVCDKHNFSAGTNFANPRKHPTKKKWAISASPRVELESKKPILSLGAKPKLIEPVELTKDWFTNNL